MPTEYKQAQDNMINTTDNKNTHNGHAFVDLGLPSGLLWATCNVGADSPEKAGLYFAWGETTGFTAEQVKRGKRKFGWNVYHEGGASSISAFLSLDLDAAHVNMGGKWRMPTITEIRELMEKCDSVWTADYNGTGVKGLVVTSKTNGNYIFLPAAGVGYVSSIYDVNGYGNYSSSTGDNDMYFLAMYFHKKALFVNSEPRYFGFSVRGVCER